MIQKIIIFIWIIWISILPTSANCATSETFFDETWNIDVYEKLKWCIETNDTGLVKKSSNIWWGDFKETILDFTQTIAGLLWLGAVFSIVFGSILLALSWGDDSRIKKGKDIIKWGIIWFFGVVSAGFLIAMVVNLVYFLGG